MTNILESKTVDVSIEAMEAERIFINGRYDFLLSEQPDLKIMKPYGFITSLLGGCVATLFLVYWDSKQPVKDGETLAILTFACFCIGTIVTDVMGRFIVEMMKRKALVQNIETLQNWKRPIIILPDSPFDPSVDARTNEITGILNDEKCLNHLHIGLENAELTFGYTIEYGFRAGDKCQTTKGLPIVGLFSELFVLRGAFDDTIWFEFQKEAVRIALEIDSDFAKVWFALESETYRTVAGGQLLI